MPQSLTSQINIRISTSLKQRGDASFAQMGYTTSEVVRAIWSLAASGARGMDALRSVLAKGTIAERGESQALEPDNPAFIYPSEDVSRLEPWELFDYYVAQLGDGCEVTPTALSDDELLEMEAFDRMSEKGLL